MTFTSRRHRALALLVVGACCATAAACGSGGAHRAEGPRSAPSPTSSVTPTGDGPVTASPGPVPSGKRSKARGSASGAAMPKGDLPGWKQVFADDFKGKALGRTWTKYHGQPGGDPDGWWEPSHVVVRNGVLELQTYREDDRWVSAGVGAWRGDGLTYGKVVVRFRAPVARGVAYALLLWPVSENWPVDGEIDFAEDGGGDRQTTTATLHFGANHSKIQRHLDADFTQWQTVGVEWTQGRLVYTINGRPWATVRSGGVPDNRMVLALQTQVWGCHVRGYACPDETTPVSSSLDVDWVVAYEPAAD